MARSAKKAREQIEGVVVSTVATAGLVLREAFGTVLVVDTAGVGVGKSFVGFGDFNELLVGGRVVGVLVRVEFLGEFSVGTFNVSVICILI